MQQQRNSLEVQEILSAMEIYLTEYIHRDTHMWSQTYRFFFAALTIMLLPYLTERLGISLPETFQQHPKIFPAVGIVLSVVFLYISLLLAKRFAAISQTYNNLVKLLPTKIRRKSIKDMPIKVLNYSPNYLLSFAMFTVLIILGIVLLV